MDLKSLTYSSWASRALSSLDIEGLLQSARVSNGLDEVTGILIYNGKAFVQVLEGCSQAVDDLMARIVQDTRHRDLLIRDEQPIAQRSFSDWSMAYCELEQGRVLGSEALEFALAGPLVGPTKSLLQEVSRTMNASV